MKEEEIIATKEVRENAAIQVQLVDLFVDALENKLIRYDIIKKDPKRLSVAISMVKDSEKSWGKMRGGEVWVRNQRGASQSEWRRSPIMEKGSEIQDSNLKFQKRKMKYLCPISRNH